MINWKVNTPTDIKLIWLPTVYAVISSMYSVCGCFFGQCGVVWAVSSIMLTPLRLSVFACLALTVTSHWATKLNTCQSMLLSMTLSVLLFPFWVCFVLAVDCYTLPITHTDSKISYLTKYTLMDWVFWEKELYVFKRGKMCCIVIMIRSFEWKLCGWPVTTTSVNSPWIAAASLFHTLPLPLLWPI